MPTLPWKTYQATTPTGEYVALASFLPLRRYSTTFRFFRHVQAIRRQLDETPGVLCYSLKAKPLRKRYWTLSLWEDDEALQAFVRAEPHRETMAALAPDLRGTVFARWRVGGSERPISWEEALARIKAMSIEPPKPR